MIKLKLIEDLTKQILSNLPANLKTLKTDIEKNVKTCVKHSLDKFDIVSREEFDVQAKALAKAQEKLAKLELKLQELEKKAKK